MTVDLDEKLKIPESDAITNLRPDMIVVSRETKQMAIIELTVSSEERIEVAGEMKRSKYEIYQQKERKTSGEFKAGQWKWAAEVSQ